MRGDPEEAKEEYNSGPIAHYAEVTDEVRETARRSGIHLGPGCRDITIGNNRRSTAIGDAFVVSASLTADDGAIGKFGPFVAEVRDPLAFSAAVRDALAETGVPNDAYLGSVIYRKNAYSGLEDAPGPLGFVKRPQFAPEREYRFLWIPTRERDLVPGFYPMQLPPELIRRVR